jgi:uncharacterized membrane protein YvbJ
MYCPKCSQQQISDEVRFCPRCGFQLDALKMLLTENQNSSAMSEIEAQTQLVSTRKKDVLLGATVMLVAAISIVLLMISSVAGTPMASSHHSLAASVDRDCFCYFTFRSRCPRSYKSLFQGCFNITVASCFQLGYTV